MASKTKFRLKANEKDSYLALVIEFPLTSIRSNEHLQAAQTIIDRLLAQGELGQGETLYLDALSDLVASYEDDHFPFSPVSDSEMLQLLEETKGISQAELSRETGLSKSTVSEVLSGKKKFSRQMIRKLADFFTSMSACWPPISRRSELRCRRPDSESQSTQIAPFITLSIQF